ncbi:hypothetical protein CEXT_26491 [Caerostris extrusa]|uniref:Uncharacterized protein n=1 Tax=Caerostris extrusa TaxID=172846 RepID=A0AAV4UEQ0_CAEEX|nr:hypothetical protein CEXT_26491 [Caerostris extrusa]
MAPTCLGYGPETGLGISARCSLVRSCGFCSIHTPLVNEEGGGGTAMKLRGHPLIVTQAFPKRVSQDTFPEVRYCAGEIWCFHCLFRETLNLLRLCRFAVGQ